jgi:hypothetical protein
MAYSFLCTAHTIFATPAARVSEICAFSVRSCDLDAPALSEAQAKWRALPGHGLVELVLDINTGGLSRVNL